MRLGLARSRAKFEQTESRNRARDTESGIIKPLSKYMRMYIYIHDWRDPTIAKLEQLYDPSGNGAINTGYNPNYPKWSVVLHSREARARPDVVRNLFNVARGGGWWFLRNSGNGCHAPNICSGNRSTLVLRETSLRAVDADRATFRNCNDVWNVVPALVTIILSNNQK